MSNTLNVGVIGVGTFGSLHAKAYAASPEAELVAVADVNAARAAEIGAQYRAASYSEYQELLARADVEAVSVCTTDEAHVGPCVAAARAGKHILVEKPLATTVADCDAILTATQQAGVVLMVGHILRFDPRYYKARESLREGTIGDAVYFYGRRDNLVSSAKRLSGHTTVLFFLGIHDIDYMNWCAGARAERVYAESVRKRLKDAPDATVALIRYANGVVGSLEVCWTLPETYVERLDAQFKIVGTEGMIFVDSSGRGVAIYTEERGHCPESFYAPSVDDRIVGILPDEIHHFIECVRTGRKPMVSGEDGKAAVQVACAIAASAAQGTAIYLD